ncbi:hypothetical protein B7494_g3282 [Chlorociboria aeruginascens]|nr:hypothetical protein B7494_g3282 [Chlorociboria aeruginascens]
MHLINIFTLLTLALAQTSPPQVPLTLDITPSNVTSALFSDLEEYSRIVDISYCVSTTGIQRPFSCASRCSEFKGFELVATFLSGIVEGGTAGYIALDHGWNNGEGVKGKEGRKGRVIVAFRGTYSIANTIVDLSTVPQEYIPYPDSPDNSTTRTNPCKEQSHHSMEAYGKLRSWLDKIIPYFIRRRPTQSMVDCATPETPSKCIDCQVHSGFWTSWQNTRPLILHYLKQIREEYPDYDLHLVGHSLGGAVAALASLEFEGLGWSPTVTTFGEPRVGNGGLRDYINGMFTSNREQRYRRVTHIDDPVPLLPLHEWGYRSHAGEIYISKADLQPSPLDIRHCTGSSDPTCIAGAELDTLWFNDPVNIVSLIETEQLENELGGLRGEEEAALRGKWGLPIPARYKIWQLFFAHRDYFWRLGLCVPGGDPLDWGRERYNVSAWETQGELIDVDIL